MDDFPYHTALLQISNIHRLAVMRRSSSVAERLSDIVQSIRAWNKNGERGGVRTPVVTKSTQVRELTPLRSPCSFVTVQALSTSAMQTAAADHQTNQRGSDQHDAGRLGNHWRRRSHGSTWVVDEALTTTVGKPLHMDADTQCR